MGRKRECKHRHVLKTMFHQSIDGMTHGCRADFCEDCNVRLPMGPSNDTPETALEVRAAEIAADRDIDRRGWSFDEETGWVHWKVCETLDCTPINDEMSAGYLARCIATHDASQEER